MKCKVYYQDFLLNTGCFEKQDLVFSPEKATFVEEVNEKEYIEQFGEQSIPTPITREDLAATAWFKMNNLEIPVGHPDRSKFEGIGHTSMSIGDYVEFEDGEVWIAAPMGWKIVPITR